MQYAYEERIAALRSELDRLTSRHAVQTEGVEQQLARLLDQQSLIQSRGFRGPAKGRHTGQRRQF
jgi:hypothetical protein